MLRAALALLIGVLLGSLVVWGAGKAGLFSRRDGGVVFYFEDEPSNGKETRRYPFDPDDCMRTRDGYHFCSGGDPSRTL